MSGREVQAVRGGPRPEIADEPADPRRGGAGGAARAAVGRHGERLAERALVAAGWQVLARNWRSPERACPGELDLVALDPSGDLVVVEVKTRRSRSCGSPLEAVTPDKLRRLRRLAAVWCRDGAGRGSAVLRIDVIGVDLPRAGAARLVHVRGVG